MTSQYQKAYFLDPMLKINVKAQRPSYSKLRA